MSSWSDWVLAKRQDVGLNEVQFFSAQDQLLALGPECVRVNGQYDDAAAVLVNGKPRTTEPRDMWLSVLQEGTPLVLSFTLPARCELGLKLNTVIRRYLRS